jgi:hypothetical protein
MEDLPKILINIRLEPIDLAKSNDRQRTTENAYKHKVRSDPLS